MPRTGERILSRFLPRPVEEAELMELEELLKTAFAGELPDLPGTKPVTQVTADSRRVRPGSLFVAVPGTAVDGTKFAAEAVERGAQAVVAERHLDLPSDVVQVVVPDARAAVADLASAFYGHPAREMTAVGITGTNGKTSTSILLRSILEKAGRPSALFGTIEYVVGDRRIPAPVTTPDPVSLMGWLREANDLGIRDVVMEVSSHALVQQRTRGVGFSIGVFTNLAPEHLDYHKDLSEYRAAKAKLFEGLDPKGTAVLNAEDPASNHFASRTRARVLRYGRSEASAVRALEIESGPQGVSFLLVLPDGRQVTIRSPLLGGVNVMNALAAAAAAHALEIKAEVIRRGIEAVRTVPGRLETVDVGQPFTVLVDYAHTDHALENVLRNIRSFAPGRRILTVMGCGGDRDRSKRPRMGRVASEYSDHVVITSDNPRSEDPMAVIRDIVAGLEGRTNFEVEPDRRTAIRVALESARDTDIVLVAGKGHETYQIVSGVVVPFDDRRVVREEIGRIDEGKAAGEGPDHA